MKSDNNQTKSLLGRTLTGLDPKLASVFLPWLLRHPKYLRAAPRMMRHHKHARQRREKLLEEEGLNVPPFLVLSVTSRCNLNCSGCFAAAVGNVNNGKQE